MAFTDSAAGATRVDGAAPEFRVAAGEAWNAGDIIGYSGGWVRASGAIRPVCVALTSASNGEADRRVALCAVASGGRYSGGTAGSVLYLSDTAGQVSESAGTTTYPVGRVVSVDTVVLYPLSGVSASGLFEGPLSLSAAMVAAAITMSGALHATDDLRVSGFAGFSGPTVLHGDTFLDRVGVQGRLDVFGNATFRRGSVNGDALAPTGWTYRDTQVTDTQLKALLGTDITLVPTQGANKAIVVHAVYLFFDVTTTAYTLGSAAVKINYGGDAADIVDITEAGFLDQATDQARMYYLGGAAATPVIIAPVANVAVVLRAATADMTGGNAANTLSIRVYYSVVDTIAFAST